MTRVGRGTKCPNYSWLSKSHHANDSHVGSNVASPLGRIWPAHHSHYSPNYTPQTVSMRAIIYSYEQFYSRSPRRRIVPSSTTYLGQGPAKRRIGALCCGPATGCALGAWHHIQSSAADPALSSSFILGIFVRIAESNPFFTLPQEPPFLNTLIDSSSSVQSMHQGMHLVVSK